MSLLRSVSLSPDPLFNPHTGQITQRFQQQLNKSGIPVPSHPTSRSGHITTVATHLLRNGCAQNNLNFYKEGRKSQLKLTYQQAVAFLADEYASRKEFMPHKKELADAIFVWDGTTDIDQCFIALIKSLEAGCKYETIYFIVKNKDARDVIEERISAQYGQNLKSTGVSIDYVFANVERNIAATGLARLKNSGKLSENYTVITDLSLVTSILAFAYDLFKEKTCFGVAATPIKNWNVEMQLHGYTKELLGSLEKATIAWASYLWILKAEQVQKEFEAYQTSVVKSQAAKKEKNRRTVIYVGACILVLLVFVKFALRKRILS
jgi:hypothetical protein